MFSPVLLLIFLLAAVLFKLLSNAFRKRKFSAEASARGCASLPILPRKGFLGLGRLSEISKANKEGRSPQWFIEKFDEIGEDVHTFKASALDYELIVTRDPENAKAMFSTQSKNFEISPHRRDIWSPLLGDGIFTAQGEQWKHSRQLLRPQFSRNQISDLDLEEQHIQSLLNLEVLKSGEQGWTQHIDLAPLFLNFTLDVATEFLYGRSVNSQSTHIANINKGNGLDSGFSYHLDAGKSWLYTKGLFGRWNRLVHSPQLTKHCKEVHRFVDELVAGRLNQPAKLSADSDRFCLLNELAKSTQNPLELRNETLQILNAGRDTTGALLGWVFYFLARNNRVFDKLRGIILTDFGRDRTGEITFEKLKQCQYLNHCIQEILRVASVVPINERVCTSDTTLPRGGGEDKLQPVFLRKGQRVLIVNHAMQHRSDLWGPDVDEFKPERWEKRIAGFEFVPFAAGPRKCIGPEQFALTETAYVIIRFLQRFDKIENSEEPGPPFFQYIFSNRSGTGVQVRLHEGDT
ncbi:Cytochrome P450 [Lachnellula subtilissima]|uniref:Cytochrome P450 n=1 Tax=Lachnellula subtilissima TaxID=602034 RepID=A0A8H8U4F0_9HELO|nr:Cytochrome P450 [Lachnellula subtilissima]